jgi:hypothetical protein
MPVTQEQFDLVRKEVSKSRFARRNYTALKGQNGYWKYRLMRPFLKYRYAVFCKKNPGLPWLTPDAISVLNKLLQSDFTALEYGSGRSTLFFSGKVKSLHSVEHNKEWYEQVKALIADSRQNNIQLTLIPPDKTPLPIRLSSEQQVFSNEKAYPNPDAVFDSYVNYISSFEANYFDFVLIDGRARKSCALEAVHKLKSGGLMVLDNSERLRYRAVHETLTDWPHIYTTTGLTDTTIWLKP